VESSRSQEAQLAGDEVSLRAQLIEIEQKQEELRSLLGRLIQEIDRQEGQEAVAREKIHANQRQKESLETDCRQFEASLQEAKFQQEEILRRQTGFTAREDAALRAVKEAEELLAQLDEESGNLEKATRSARTDQLDSLGKVAERKNFFAQGASLLRAADARVARLEQEIAAAQNEAETLAQSEAAKKQELEQLEASLPGLRTLLASSQDQIEEARTAVEACRGTETQIAEKLLATKSRLEALEQLVRAREGFSPAVRTLIEEGFAVVSDLIKAPGEWSVAIEAALGEWAESLVCKNDEEALRGRELLRQNGGQAGFLILESLPSFKNPDFSSVDASGIIGKAFDLVQYAPQYRPLFEYFLGNVIIVQDIESALRLRHTLPSGDWKIVTLEGEIIFAGGMHLGTAREAAGPLSRQAEIESLREVVTGLEAEMVQASAATEKARAALVKSEETTASTREQINSVESRRLTLEEGLNLLRAQMGKNQPRLDVLVEEKASLEEEIRQSRQEQAALEQEIASLENLHRRVESGLAETETALRELRERREGVAQELAQRKVALTALAGERQAEETRIQGLLESQKTLTAQIHSRQESLRLLETERQELEATVAAVEKHLGELRAARQKAQTDVEAVAVERQQMLEAIAAKLEETKQNREQRENNQASLHRLQLRITQLEGELDFLRRNLEEDHRVTVDKAREIAQPVENRGEATERATALQASLEAMGTVNLGAMEEYERVKSRLDFLSTQRQDLEKAREDLERVIAEIDETAREKFLECFHAVQKEFDGLFKRLFGGGETELRLTGEGEILEAGIDVEVTIPGKRRQNLLLLSGGERALTAMALVFSLLRVKPTPFVVLDEIDAPLDDSNVGRYNQLLREFARDSQFIVITHNKGTMEAADTLYGVTMEKAGVSALIGMRLSALPAA
jgi:chromosome segregation protein